MQATDVTEHPVKVVEMSDADAYADPVPGMVTSFALSPVPEACPTSLNTNCSPGSDPLLFMQSLGFLSDDFDIAGGRIPLRTGVQDAAG